MASERFSFVPTLAVSQRPGRPCRIIQGVLVCLASPSSFFNRRLLVLLYHAWMTGDSAREISFVHGSVS